MITYREVSGKALEALEHRNAAPVKAIRVPFEEWAVYCMGRGGNVGLAHGWHVLAAGRSGEGKTYLAANVAAAAIDASEGVTFHSLEMDWDELAVRILAIVSGEPAYRLNPGKHFSRDSFRAARVKMNATKGALHVNDEPMHKLSDLLSGIRRNFEEHGARLHIVDYLQLAWTGNAESQAARITEVSHAVRQVAKELRIVTFCLSQFNRDTSKNRAERPSKEGMIGGSALENDADQVLLLDHSRRELIRDNTGRASGWDGWLLLDKNRHGPSGDIPIRFVAETGRMRQRYADEVRDEEVTK
jgi:replicative DNA helicase